jgi:hypothetical protein
MQIIWPINILTPFAMAVNKMPATLKGNPSLSGVTQRIASDAGRWMCSMSGIPLVTKDKIKLWRAIEGMAEGQLGQFIVPIQDIDRGPAGENYGAEVLHFGDVPFFGDVPYSASSYIASASMAAALGATQIALQVSSSPMPEPGQFFSIGLRLYSINRIVSTVGAVMTVKVSPPLREAVVAGAFAEFGEPKLLCRLASDDAMRLKNLDMSRWGSADIDFIEDTGPEMP